MKTRKRCVLQAGQWKTHRDLRAKEMSRGRCLRALDAAWAVSAADAVDLDDATAAVPIPPPRTPPTPPTPVSRDEAVCVKNVWGFRFSFVFFLSFFGWRGEFD